MADASFDIVSKVDRQEVDNALNQAGKEIGQRFDFKGTGASIRWSGENGVEIAANSDMSVDWLLPYTRPKSFKAGAILMARGDYATAAYYITAGEVEVLELNVVLGKGTFIGEIGLFTPDGRRTRTIRCKTDVETAVIDYDQFKQLYFQNPQFGFRLLHLIVARLQESRELPPSAVPT